MEDQKQIVEAAERPVSSALATWVETCRELGRASLYSEQSWPVSEPRPVLPLRAALDIFDGEVDNILGFISSHRERIDGEGYQPFLLVHEISERSELAQALAADLDRLIEYFESHDARAFAAARAARHLAHRLAALA